MMEINRLPAEMLLEVHRRLTPSALKKAVLMDKLWRDVGQDPALWEWCKVAVYTKEDIDNLSIERIKQIKEIYINPAKWDAHDWEAFFQAVEEFSCLEKIDGLGWGPNGLNLVETGLFARTLAKLEDVTVRRCTYDHIEALFKEMSSSTQVKRFRLWSGDLSQMESALFARVLSRLENLQLGVHCVTKDQMQALFTEILKNRSLKRLDLLEYMDLNIWNYLEPGFFGRVLSTVQDVFLSDCCDFDGVHRVHLKALFSELSVETQLKRLHLRGAEFDGIEPAVLANALAGLEELRLEWTSIFTNQIQALFTEMSLRNQMKKIVMMRIDLSQLDPELFARVMVRLEEVDLTASDITIAQMLAFFTEMSSNDHLKSLTIARVDLSSVDPEVLAKAVTQLETLKLFDTDITNDQLVSLFLEMSRNTVMKNIDLDFVRDDLGLFFVEPEVLASTLIRLEEVSLRGISITYDQAMAFFTQLSRNSSMKKLVLSGSNFSRVETEVLAAAVTNVKEVDIRGCNLSTEQISSIFTHLLEAEKKLRKLNLGVAAADVNPEIVRKVEEKLKGQLL